MLENLSIFVVQQQQQLAQCNVQLLGREHAQGHERSTMLNDDVDDSIESIEIDTPTVKRPPRRTGRRASGRGPLKPLVANFARSQEKTPADTHLRLNLQARIHTPNMPYREGALSLTVHLGHMRSQAVDNTGGATPPPATQ